MNKYFLLPSSQIGRLEALKQIQSKPLLAQAHKHEERMEESLNNSDKPYDLLLKGYSDALSSYKAFIQNLERGTPVEKKIEKEEDVEEELMDESTPKAPEKLDVIASLPSKKSKRKGELILQLINVDKNTDERSGDVYLKEKKIGSLEEVVQYFATDLK